MMVSDERARKRSLLLRSRSDYRLAFRVYGRLLGEDISSPEALKGFLGKRSRWSARKTRRYKSDVEAGLQTASARSTARLRLAATDDDGGFGGVALGVASDDAMLARNE